MAVAIQANAGPLAAVQGFTSNASVCDALPVFPEAQGLQYKPLTPFAGISQQKLREAKGFPPGTACLMVAHEGLVCGRPAEQAGAEPALIHESTSVIQIKQLLPFAEWQKRQFIPGTHVNDSNSGVVFCRSTPLSVGDFHVTDIVQRLARCTAAAKHRMFVGPREVSLKSSVEAVFTAAVCSAMEAVSEADPLPLLLLVPGCAKDNYRATLSRCIMAANVEPVGFMSIASGLAVFREQNARTQSDKQSSGDNHKDATLRLVLELGEMHVNASAVQATYASASSSSSAEKTALAVRTLACAGTCEIGLGVCDMMKAEETLRGLTDDQLSELSAGEKMQMLHKARSSRTWTDVVQLADRRFDSCSATQVFDPLLVQRNRCKSLREVVRTSVQRCMEVAQINSVAEFSEIVVCTGLTAAPDQAQLLAFVADVLQGDLQPATDAQSSATTVHGVAVELCTFKDAFHGAILSLVPGRRVPVTECLSSSIGVCYRGRTVADENLTIRACQEDTERIAQHVSWVLTAGRSLPAEETLFVPPAAAAAEHQAEVPRDLQLHAASKLALQQEETIAMTGDAEKGYTATCPAHGRCDLVVVQDGMPFSDTIDVITVVSDPLRVPSEQADASAPPAAEKEDDDEDEREDREPRDPAEEAQAVAEYFDELLREEAAGSVEPPEYAKLAKVEVGVCRGLARAHVAERAVKLRADSMFKWAVRVALIAMIVSAGLITAYNRAYMRTEEDRGLRQALIDLYEKVNPDKVSLVDQLLAKNVGREEELLRRVKRKYNLMDSAETDSFDGHVPWEERRKATREKLSEYRSKLFPQKETTPSAESSSNLPSPPSQSTQTSGSGSGSVSASSSSASDVM